MHPLDNVIWQALTTRQAQCAETHGSARRFPREVTSLSAFAEPSPAGYSSLAGLVSAGNTTAVFLDSPYQPRPGWDFVGGAPLLEMVCDNGAATVPASSEIVELESQDSPQMVELANLT